MQFASAVDVIAGVYELAGLHVRFPSAAADWEQIVLRYTHFVAGFIWVGMGYFFSLCRAPHLKSIEGAKHDASYRGPSAASFMVDAMGCRRSGATGAQSSTV